MSTPEYRYKQLLKRIEELEAEFEQAIIIAKKYCQYGHEQRAVEAEIRALKAGDVQAPKEGWIKARNGNNYFFPLQPCYIAYRFSKEGELLVKFWDGVTPMFNNTTSIIEYYLPINLPAAPTDTEN